jgi:hypothetical protein
MATLAVPGKRVAGPILHAVTAGTAVTGDKHNGNPYKLRPVIIAVTGFFHRLKVVIFENKYHYHT